jgi:hypothetical protein
MTRLSLRERAKAVNMRSASSGGKSKRCILPGDWSTGKLERGQLKSKVKLILLVA